MTATRVIATDLDGTLLRADRTISPRTIAALRACAKAGIAVVFVTGRPPRTVVHLAADTGIAITAICSNGALILDCATGDLQVISEFTADEARRIVEQLRPALPDAGFALETGSEVWHESAYGLGVVSGDGARLQADPFDAAYRKAERIVKVLARSPTLSADQMTAATTAALTLPAEVSHSGATGLVEIAPPGATKAAALAHWCAERGIDAAEVTAFGDMPNDLPMLHWAGRSYAVANAHPDVLAAADHTTAAHDQDGVALVLEELLAADGVSA